MSSKNKLNEVLRKEINRLFPGFQINENAPKGQNDFSNNIILEKNGEKSLLKIVDLKKIYKGNESQVTDEVSSLKKVKSPFVVSLINAIKTNEYIFIQLPFIEGQNLREYSQAKKLSKDEIKNIGISLLRAVSDLSRFGVVHQDIKPENIMITSDGGVKLVDFGSVRFNKSYFKGKTKTNRSYSAPEQIAGDKATLVEDLRINCDEKFDVYAIGVILYELITGALPYNSNEDKLKNIQVSDISSSVISGDFKKVIFALLNYSPRHRPLANEAVVFIENERLTPKPLSRGEFYYSSTNVDATIEKVLSLKDNGISGVILNASQTGLNRINKYKFSEIKKMVDPQLYLIQFDKAQNKQFKKLPYFDLCLNKTSKKTDLDLLSDKTNRNLVVQEILDYQLTIGPDFLISPSLLIRDFGDNAWTIDQELTQETLSVFDKKKIVLPILKSVILGQDILNTSKSRGKILDYLKSSAIKNFDGYFMLLETSVEVMLDENWLLSAKELITALLATGKPVILSRAPVASLVFSHMGVSLGMGENQSQRHFFLNTEEHTPKNRSTLMYMPEIFCRVKTPSSLFSLNNTVYNDLVSCSDACCKNIIFSEKQDISQTERYTHFVYKLSKQFQNYSVDKIKIEEDLNRAQKIIGALKKDKNFIVDKFVTNELRPNTASFIDVWISVLNKQ